MIKSYEDLATYWVARLFSQRRSSFSSGSPTAVVSSNPVEYSSYGRIQLVANEALAGKRIIAAVYTKDRGTLYDKRANHYRLVRCTLVNQPRYVQTFVSTLEQYFYEYCIIEYPFPQLPKNLCEPFFPTFYAKYRFEQPSPYKPKWYYPFMAVAAHYVRQSLRFFESKFLDYYRAYKSTKTNAASMAELLQEPFQEEKFSYEALLQPYPEYYSLYATYRLACPERFR